MTPYAMCLAVILVGMASAQTHTHTWDELNWVLLMNSFITVKDLSSNQVFRCCNKHNPLLPVTHSQARLIVLRLTHLAAQLGLIINTFAGLCMHCTLDYLPLELFHIFK